MCSGSERACQTGRFGGMEVCGKRKPWSNASDKAEKDILANNFEIKNKKCSKFDNLQA